MKNIGLKIKDFLLKFWDKINEDNAFGLAAALAYYTVFSLAPFLFILINFLGLIFDVNAVRTSIFEGLADLIGPSGAMQLETTLINIGISDAGWLKSLIGGVILIFTATTIFSTIQTGLNYVFRVMPKPKIGILKFFKTRLLAFSIIIGFAFILVVSLFINGLISFLSTTIILKLPFLENIIGSLNNFFLPFIISVTLFFIIFKFLPDATVKTKDLIIGALFTGLLFSVGRYLIGFYVGNSDIANVYDAAGSLMVIFVWVYYSSFIFYVGAIFTVIYAEEIGGGVIPEKNTLRFIQREIKVADEMEEVKANRIQEKIAVQNK